MTAGRLGRHRHPELTTRDPALPGRLVRLLFPTTWLKSEHEDYYSKNIVISVVSYGTKLLNKKELVF